MLHQIPLHNYFVVLNHETRIGCILNLVITPTTDDVYPTCCTRPGRGFMLIEYNLRTIEERLCFSKIYLEELSEQNIVRMNIIPGDRIIIQNVI